MSMTLDELYKLLAQDATDAATELAEIALSDARAKPLLKQASFIAEQASTFREKVRRAGLADVETEIVE